MKTLCLAIAMLLTACSDHGPTASTTQTRELQIAERPTSRAVTTTQAPATASVKRPATSQARIATLAAEAPQRTTVTLRRIDGTSRPYEVPPEQIIDGAVWPVLEVDGIRYEQDGNVWRERTPQEIRDQRVRDLVTRHLPYGP